MKKIILILLAIICITGCGKEGNITLDLDKATKNVEELKYKDEYVYSNLKYLTSEEIKNTYQFDTSYFEEFIIAMPKMNVQSNMYMILKVKENKIVEAKNELAAFDEKYIESWKLYLPEQAELVKNKLQTEKGDYLIYIVSNNNNLVLKTILNSK